jgi:hypothetical protein
MANPDYGSKYKYKHELYKSTYKIVSYLLMSYTKVNIVTVHKWFNYIIEV